MLQQPLPNSAVTAAAAAPANMATDTPNASNSNQNHELIHQKHSPQINYNKHILKQQHYLPPQATNSRPQLNGLSAAAASVVNGPQFVSQDPLQASYNQIQMMSPQNNMDLYSTTSALHRQQRPQVYAPKPTNYFAQQQNKQQNQSNLNNYASSQQIVAQQQALYTQHHQAAAVALQSQQQHSPASINFRQHHQIINSIVSPNQPAASEFGLQTAALTSDQIQQLLAPKVVQASASDMSSQLAQMQARVQQQQQLEDLQHQQNRLVSSIHQNHAHYHYQQQQQHQQHQQQQQHLQTSLKQQPLDASRWYSLERQHASVAFENQPSTNLVVPDRAESVSTADMSRINDRRSYTLRSQYTSRNNNNNMSTKFSFFKLTREATKRLLGFSHGSLSSMSQSRDKFNNDTFHENINDHLNNQQHAADNHSKNLNSNLNSSNCLSAANNINYSSSNNKITALDTGEDYQFNKSVFKYQLVISRIFSLLCAMFVLLSPVSMLLIPKMESVFGSSNEPLASNSLPFSFQQSQSPSSLSSSSNSQNQQPFTIRAHSVGLSDANKLGPTQSQLHNQYYISQPQWKISECSIECDGYLIGFIAKFFMLVVSYWATFVQPRTSFLARLNLVKCYVLVAAVALTICYWSFFIFRIFDKRYGDYDLAYETIVKFSISMLDALIMLHYMSVVLFWLWPKKKVYCVKVVRSPDGASEYYKVGSLSIQKCAQFVLEKYECNFKTYGPYSEHVQAIEQECAKTLTLKLHSNNNNNDSRPNSPTISTRGSTSGRSRRSTSRSASKHHHHHHHSRSSHRSPSKSPVDRDRSSSSKMNLPNHKRSVQEPLVIKQKQQQHLKVDSDDNSNHTQVKIADKTQAKHVGDENNSSSGFSPKKNDDNKQMLNTDADTKNNPTTKTKTTTATATKTEQQSNDKANDSSNSADVSSDATGRMKDESSLETIRAASTSDLLDNQQGVASSSSSSATAVKSLIVLSDLVSESAGGETSKQSQVAGQDLTMRNNSTLKSSHNSKDKNSSQQHNHRIDGDVESVRSGRSKRSTRSHQRTRHHHHKSSSYRGNENQINNTTTDELSTNEFSDHNNRSRYAASDKRSKSPPRLLASSMSFVGTSTTTAAFEPLNEHEKKLKRRTCRLLVDVVDAFAKMKQADEVSNNAAVNIEGGLPASQAARTLYPSIARSLQKYLRFTKQTTRHNLQSIHEHLTKCLVYKLGARTFLEKFINLDPVLQSDETKLFAKCQTAGKTNLNPMYTGDYFNLSSWSIISDTLVSRQINSGTFFILKQGSVSLLVTVARLPRISLVEEIVDVNASRYIPLDNSETCL